MPEEEGYIGIISKLRQAELIMEYGPAKEFVQGALAEVIAIAKRGVTNPEMGMEFYRLTTEAEALSRISPTAIWICSGPGCTFGPTSLGGQGVQHGPICPNAGLDPKDWK